MRAHHIGFILLLAVSLGACGGDSSSGGGAADAGGDAAATSGQGDAAVADAGADAAAADTATTDDATADVIEDAEGDASTACELPEVSPAPGLVATDRGYVQGDARGDVWAFLGIPYVAPPVGERRWKAPEPAACWEEVLAADSYSPKCPQIEVTRQGASVVGDEDCLSLNVWTPAEGADGGKRPVLFFIHGGGNIVGSASQEIAPGRFIYDGRPLAERGDVVVVTFNYRIGPLGFMKLPQLDAESSVGASGNYGLLDQVAALEWVQRNIEAFGGDPERVMVFGESAGGVNTCMMMASPLATGLFHRALIQCAPCLAVTGEVGEQNSETAVGLTPCADEAEPLACLRGLDALELVELAPGSVGIGASPTGSDLSWGPAVDGHVLEELPDDAIAAGRHNQVPFVIGSNADEMAAENINRVQINSEAAYRATVEAAFSALGDDVPQRILEAYPVDDYPTPNDAFIQLATDASFTCPTRTVVRNVAAHQEAPVYRYFFTRRPDLASGDGRAAHGIELLYVFRSLENIPLYNPTEAELQVADAMMDYWIRFAATGDPNGDGDPAWPTYDVATDPHLIIDAPVSTGEGVRTAKCDLWDDIGEL